jgi:hypothetical protein
MAVGGCIDGGMNDQIVLVKNFTISGSLESRM